MSHPGRRPDIYIYIYIRTPRWVTHFISGVLLHLIDVFCIICLVQNTLWNAHVSSCFPCVHRCMFLLCSPKPRKTLAFWTLVEDHTHTQSPPNLLAHTLPGPIHGFHRDSMTSIECLWNLQVQGYQTQPCIDQTQPCIDQIQPCMDQAQPCTD